MSFSKSALTRLIALCLSLAGGTVSGNVKFDARSAQSGNWSDARTWADGRAPRAGDFVQIRAGHRVTYDVRSDAALRMIHVAGTLTFSRERSTLLNVGLIKIERGEDADEDGFTCSGHDVSHSESDPAEPMPALEIGTTERPIPPGITATIRLSWFPGTDRDNLPAIIDCGGRWDVHGAPMDRTWLKLSVPSKPGDTKVSVTEPVHGWRTGDHVIVTAMKEPPHSGGDARKGKGPDALGTEDRTLTAIDGAELTLDRPLDKPHAGELEEHSEVADLSRNVVIESADWDKPTAVRGHTMYHRGSSGGISYAEFRHLGKEGLLGRYAIHFHLVRDSMRGSGVIGASIWDSANRWLTIHGTDYLVVRDCVGYQSIGHGFFMEDGTEQYNLLDRNLAVQAFSGKPLPHQALGYDDNAGAGFWWANGRNTLVRNVSCENDRYGFRFDIQPIRDRSATLPLRQPDGSVKEVDVRTIPFFRFEDNESHSEGLYSFYFGEDPSGQVHGDKQHPFIARNLRAWHTHYGLRPNLKAFLMDGLDVTDGVYGVYAPEYDMHVYRNVRVNRVVSEPINRGHDDASYQYGSFTYDNLKIEDCRTGRDPLIQLTCTSPQPGETGHFRNVTIRNSGSPANVVDLGGGPRNDKLENGVVYYFHDVPPVFSPGDGRVVKVVSVKFPNLMTGGKFKSIAGFTGVDVRAAEVPAVAFPVLLDPVDDLPPATMITSVRRAGQTFVVHGISHDDVAVATVHVNGRNATVLSSPDGLAEWEATLDAPPGGLRAITAAATDTAGNVEMTPATASAR